MTRPTAMTVVELIQEVIDNAPADRAGGWLLEAADEFPELFAAIVDNLDADPAKVISDLIKRYPTAAVLLLLPQSRPWISNLQQFFKERYK